jgi:RNA-directed DNA polymerase
MQLERRDRTERSKNVELCKQEKHLEKIKPFNISKRLVFDAYKKVKSNKGAAGIDDQSLAEFDVHLGNNLYKLWNRMASGSYFPPPVKAVEIPKRSGGKRMLGIPTVADRIAQTVVTMMIEEDLDKLFHENSYGYRPNKQALEGVAVTRQRCWKYEWLVEYDIKGLFDNINHEKLMKAVERHVQENWILLYIKRWLTASIQHKNGELKERTKGTPQGGVVSPVLSNLFLHYAIDMWMTKNHPNILWARYADDGVMHCSTEEEAIMLKQSLAERLKECDLEIHPDKTKIVYCGNEQKETHTSFTFLGFTFHKRRAQAKTTGKVFTSFLPAIGKDRQKSIRQEIRKDNIRARSDLSLEQIAEWYNPKLRGWYNYFGKFYPSKLAKIWVYFNKALVLWAKSKYKNIRTGTSKAIALIKRVQEKCSSLFFHWKLNQGKGIYV